MTSQLAIISGKGGTGKTSIVASFASLAQPVVLADCDVDAADLHLVAEPLILRREKFSGGSRARIMPGHCTACGVCEDACRFDAVSYDGPGNGIIEKTFRVDPITCEGCGVCAYFCPDDAIEFAPAVNGEWFLSETRFGPMVHAELGVAEENSGKLVSIVRMQAETLAKERGLDLIVIDGPPGIGCPVIASITGVDSVLVVTEPTLSGKHDLERVADLAGHFGIPAMVCVNKWDLNKEITARIESRTELRGLRFVGQIRYDRGITEAQIRKKAVVEYQTNGCAEDIRRIWAEVEGELRKKKDTTER